MTRTVLVTAFLCSLLSHPLSAATLVQTFDTNPVLAPSQTPNAWYVDRYAPAAFESVPDPTGNPGLTGGNVLHHGISAADGLNNRPNPYNIPFYNTQGRSYVIPAPFNGPGTYWSADLYIPSDWETTGRRMAGMWGIGKDGANAQSAFPIIEFASNGTNGFFQYFDSNVGFVNIGLPTDFVYDEWYNAQLTFTGTTFDVEVKGATGPSTNVLSLSDPNTFGTVLIENIILEGYNNTAGVTYDIYWDNVTTLDLDPIPPPAPEPSSLALLVLGALGLTRIARRRDE
jgi:hypothetical protein